MGHEDDPDAAPPAGAPEPQEEEQPAPEEEGEEEEEEEAPQMKFPNPPRHPIYPDCVVAEECPETGELFYPGYLAMVKELGDQRPWEEEPWMEKPPEEVPGPVATGENLWFASRAGDIHVVNYALRQGLAPDGWVPQEADSKDGDSDESEDESEDEDEQGGARRRVPPLVALREREIGMTALGAACAYRHAEVVQALLAAGAAVDKPTAQGLTPLAVAARSGCLEAVRALLGASADPAGGPPPVHGHSPLFYAVSGGHTKIVRALLAAGLDPRQPDALSGQTPLATACCVQSPKTALVRALAEGCVAADPGGTPESRFGALPLVFAAWKGRAKLVKALLDAGADPSLVDHRGVRPLVAALARGHADVEKLLVDAGATAADLAPFQLMTREEAESRGATLHEPPVPWNASERAAVLATRR